jgi:purine nucleosidase
MSARDRKAWIPLLLMTTSLPMLAAERIIFDTDSGPFNDDGAALVLLLANVPHPAVSALTIVTGNVWAPQGAEYMLHTLDLMHRPDIPVYVGAHRPLMQTAERAVYAEKHFGPIAFQGAFAEKYPAAHADLRPPYGGRFSDHRAESQSAVEHLIDATEKDPGNITILALGPMTNLAMALRLRPDIAGKIKRLVFMGGNVHVPGNASAAAEFNFWFDPEAARIVLRSAIPRKVMFGLDICNRAVLTRRLFDEIIAVDTPVTGIYKQDYGRRYPGFLTNPNAVCYLWDELAAVYLFDPSFVTKTEERHLDVTTEFGPKYGATVDLDRRMAPAATPVEVMLDLDFAKFAQVYVSSFQRAGR